MKPTTLTSQVLGVLRDSAAPLSTNDVYLRLLKAGAFIHTPANKARSNISGRLSELRDQHKAASYRDESKGLLLWSCIDNKRTPVKKPVVKTAADTKIIIENDTVVHEHIRSTYTPDVNAVLVALLEDMGDLLKSAAHALKPRP